MTSSIPHHLSCIVSVHDGHLGVHIGRSLCGEVWKCATRVLASHVVGSDIEHTYKLISQVWSAFYIVRESCCEAEKKELPSNRYRCQFYHIYSTGLIVRF